MKIMCVCVCVCVCIQLWWYICWPIILTKWQMTRKTIQFGSFINISVVLFCSSMLTSAFLLQHGAEFRRFSVDRLKPGKFEEFYKLIMTIHRIANMEVMIGYADVHGDLLPINNDENFSKAVSTAHPLLRIFIQRQGTSSLSTHIPLFSVSQFFFALFVFSSWMYLLHIVWWLV